MLAIFGIMRFGFNLKMTSLKFEKIFSNLKRLEVALKFRVISLEWNILIVEMKLPW